MTLHDIHSLSLKVSHPPGNVTAWLFSLGSFGTTAVCAVAVERVALVHSVVVRSLSQLKDSGSFSADPPSGSSFLPTVKLAAEAPSNLTLVKEREENSVL